MEKLLNYRRVDPKFSISGGWDNLYENIDFLKSEKIVAVLDVQWVDWDSDNVIHQVKQACADEDIELVPIRFDDGINENMRRTREIIEQGRDEIERLVEKYPDKKQRILIKCAAGISRSPTMYLAYIAKRDRLIFEEAKATLDDAEYRLGYGYGDFWGNSPNFFFRKILREMYGSYWEESA